MGIGCLKTCRFKCRDKITHEDRTKIFTNHWALENHKRQWDFIDNLIVSAFPKEAKSKVHCKGGFYNTVSRKYFLTMSNGTKVKVCRTMFLHTLGMY